MKSKMPNKEFDPMNKKYILGSVTSLVGLLVMMLGVFLFAANGFGDIPVAFIVGGAITVPGTLLALVNYPSRIETKCSER